MPDLCPSLRVSPQGQNVVGGGHTKHYPRIFISNFMCHCINKNNNNYNKNSNKKNTRLPCVNAHRLHRIGCFFWSSAWFWCFESLTWAFSAKPFSHPLLLHSFIILILMLPKHFWMIAMNLRGQLVHTTLTFSAGLATEDSFLRNSGWLGPRKLRRSLLPWKVKEVVMRKNTTQKHKK